MSRYTKFSERLKQLRENMKISQRELARQTGISSAMISLYEANKKTPTIDVLIKLAKFFEVSADYLLGLTDNPQPWQKDLPEHIKKELDECRKLKKK